MNTYIKPKDKWQVWVQPYIHRDLKWHEWIDLRLIQLRDWIHLLGKEK